MTIDELNIPGVVVLTPKRFADDRGWFMETYSHPALQALGIELDFVQDNHSLSLHTGTLRGLHFQTPPHAQAKLVRCVRGRILDVAVDVRANSPTYGQYASAELSAADARQIFIPVGFAHGFVTLEPDTEVVYKVSDIYAPQCDGGIRWNDPTIAFPWNIEHGPFLSPKDEKLPLLADFVSPFRM
ncbi:dTDP-4-dehydrorhamnose 3,5-epimerase [Rhodopseudomonas palustris]|uniref:dTDP-4-dehydrorhamnose 3,5-epimerase n=1 Tax=Rhodopseudomonas palustris (strain BisB18) TaxID=316056 RepID=Q20YQ5_RHOPB